MGSIHPFTACSLPMEGSSIDKKTSELVLYIRPHRGLTSRLLRFAESGRNDTIPVLLDGPYGGIHSEKLATSDRQIFVAGGSGSGWVLPVITAFLYKNRAQIANGLSPDRLHSAKIILATRDTTTQAWFEETLRELFATFNLEAAPAHLEIALHYTGTDQETSAQIAHTTQEKPEQYVQVASTLTSSLLAGTDSDSSSNDVRPASHLLRHFSTRPDLRTIIHSEATSITTQSQLGVFVCGPLSMQNDVSNAVADEQLAALKGTPKDIYLHMEHFSWA
jgi:hypothetical protein